MGRVCYELAFRTLLIVSVKLILAGSWILLNYSTSYALEKFHQVSIATAQWRDQEGGSVSRVNIGRLITASVTSRHTSMFFKMAGNFLVRHFCKR